MNELNVLGYNAVQNIEDRLTNSLNEPGIIKSYDGKELTYYSIFEKCDVVKKIEKLIVDKQSRGGYELTLDYNVRNKRYDDDVKTYDNLEKKFDYSIKDITKALIEFYNYGTQDKISNIVKIKSRTNNVLEFYTEDAYNYSFTLQYVDSDSIFLRLNYKSTGTYFSRFSDIESYIEKQNELFIKYDKDYYFTMDGINITLMPRTYGKYEDFFKNFITYLGKTKGGVKNIKSLKGNLMETDSINVRLYGVITRRFKYYDLVVDILTVMKLINNLKMTDKIKNIEERKNRISKYIREMESNNLSTLIQPIKLTVDTINEKEVLSEELKFDLTKHDAMLIHMNNNSVWKKGYQVIRDMERDFYNTKFVLSDDEGDMDAEDN